MIDPRQEAMSELGRLLDRGSKKLNATQCERMVQLVQLVPGWVKRVAQLLSAQRSSAGAQSLQKLPAGVPGVVEGLHKALLQGLTRTRVDGSVAPPMLAIDFRHSRAKQFEELLSRAMGSFGDGLASFRVHGKLQYRCGLQATRGTLAGQAAATAHELSWLHARLTKLRGTRLWLNGWCFPADGTFGAGAQTHLLQAWFSWASTQTHTRS